MERVETIARLLCEQHGGEPDAVASEPHDCWEGSLWSVFAPDANAILAALSPQREDTGGRFITTWRKTGDQVLDWDHYVSECRADAETVIANLKKRGVHQYHTYPIGTLIVDLSSEY